MHEEEKAPIPWGVIWAVVAFLIGVIFSAGMGWGRSSSAIDNLTVTITQMKSSIDLLTINFNNANADTRERLKGVEDKLQSQQSELDELRSQTKKN